MSKANGLKLDYELAKHELKENSGVNGTNAVKPKSAQKAVVGEKRNHTEMTQTQKDNDYSSITSYSNDDFNGNADTKKQKVTNDDSSDL